MTSRPLPFVLLRKALGRTVKLGHPWLYRDALEPMPALASGSLAAVLEKGQTAPLGWGYWDAVSPIALRLMAPGPPPAGASTTQTIESMVQGVVQARLEDALARRLERLDLEQTNAFRWVHGEADALPGIHVDVYGHAATVRYDGEGAAAFFADLMHLPERLKRIGKPHGIEFVVERRRRGGSQGDEPTPFVVRENGLRFLVDLVHGQKGGLFLDQRDNRARVAAIARGKRVLNLFGYTGGFSVYAASAGAAFTDTVDIAAPAMAAARGNFELNGLPLDHAGFHATDAFAFLEAAIAAGTTWDIVISDPPSFAPSQKALPTALAAYRKLHALAVQVVSAGGLLAAASCSSHVTRALFTQTVQEGAQSCGLRFVPQSYAGAGFDHPVVPSFPEGDYLKFVVGHLQRHS